MILQSTLDPDNNNNTKVISLKRKINRVAFKTVRIHIRRKRNYLNKKVGEIISIVREKERKFEIQYIQID